MPASTCHAPLTRVDEAPVPTACACGQNEGVDVTGYLEKMTKLIEKYGWAVQAVGGDAITPPFAYTVGLTARKLPEIYVSGLPIPLMQSALNQAAKQAESLQLDVPSDEYFNMPVIFKKRIAEGARVAREMYGRDKVRLIQMYWPDPTGVFPWEPECDTLTRRCQPIH